MVQFSNQSQGHSTLLKKKTKKNLVDIFKKKTKCPWSNQHKANLSLIRVWTRGPRHIISFSLHGITCTSCWLCQWHKLLSQIQTSLVTVTINFCRNMMTLHFCISMVTLYTSVNEWQRSWCSFFTSVLTTQWLLCSYRMVTTDWKWKLCITK